MMYLADVLFLIELACERAGGQSAWAREIGEHKQVVSLTLSGHRRPSARICKALRIHPVLYYENDPAQRRRK